MDLAPEKGFKAATAYRVDTDRLVLRCWSPDDAPRLRAALDIYDEYLMIWNLSVHEYPQTFSANTTYKAFDCLDELITQGD